MKAILLAALFTVGQSSFTLAESPRASESKTPPPTAPAATLGFIETNDRSIEIKASGTGSYTVRSKDGKILAESISVSQLQARFPQLHQLMHYGYARNTDARLNLNRSTPIIMRSSAIE